jgi:SAM-dependent methyltransferase
MPRSSLNGNSYIKNALVRFPSRLSTSAVGEPLIRRLMSSTRWLDGRLLNSIGIPYAVLTRDWLINERMHYLTDWAVRSSGRLRVLDAGCGSGLSFLYLQQRCANKMEYYAGLDLDTRRLRERYRHSIIPHDFIDADLDSPWPLGSFDLVFASEVIEHIVDDRGLFCRLCEHLTENGLLIITTPNKRFVKRMAEFFPGFDAVSPVQDGGHVRVGYEPGDLLELARTCSLRLIACDYLGWISVKELTKRELKRNHGAYLNTAWFNWSWLIRSVHQRSTCEDLQDGSWSLAMVFQRV